VSLETVDDSSIKWLDPHGKVWFEVNQLNVGWLIGDIVAQKVIEMKTNFSLLTGDKGPFTQWVHVDYIHWGERGT
jgi:hypothetical protein